MHPLIRTAVPALLLLISASAAHTLERPDTVFSIFQFPRNRIPRIDGDTTDWDIVGDAYTYRTDQLDGTRGGHGAVIDTTDIDVAVRIAWVEGLDRLYVLYEAYDDYWDFGLFDEKQPRGYQNDIFELCVDADLSGGPFIRNPQLETVAGTEGEHMGFAGAHAQNYHIFTPPVNNQWCMVWGANPWIARFPWANWAYAYDFEPGQPGRLVLECWITPFDYAPFDGPERAVASKLEENAIIALSWAILDFDHGEKDGPGNCNLAHHRDSVKDASRLCAFRLMPLEPAYESAIEARFSWTVIDDDRHLVYFRDESAGEITSWTWHFGDGATSSEQHPVHAYPGPGPRYTVWLDVTGPDGNSRQGMRRMINIK